MKRQYNNDRAMFADRNDRMDEGGTDIDNGNDNETLGLPPNLYNVVELLSTKITTKDGNLLNDNTFVQSCVIEAIKEIKSLDLPAYSSANKNNDSSSLPSQKISNIKFSEDMTMMEFVELLRKVPDWDVIQVVVIANEKSISSSRINNKLEFFSKIENIKKEDVESILLAGSKNRNIMLNEGEPWKESLTYEFLSSLYPREFPNIMIKERVLEKLEDKFKISSMTSRAVYYSDFVTTEPSVDVEGAFCSDSSKSKVLVIGGESGSGKTFFATRTIPDKLRSSHKSTGFLYHTLQRGNEIVAEEDSPLKPSLELLLQTMAIDYEGTDWFQYLSDANMNLNKLRNNRSLSKFQGIWRQMAYDSSEMNRWWSEWGPTSSHLTLDRLVIIIDEIGKDLNFGYGVVEMGRTIVDEVCTLGRAKECLLVLVGTGSDVLALGADPTKATVIVMKEPKIEILEEHGLVLQKEVLGGTISRVLADNARMLMFGIVPIYTSEVLTQYYEEDEDGLALRATDRIETGSNSAMMHYCYRIYISLNSLGDMPPERVTVLMKDLFQFLIKKELKPIVDNRILGDWHSCAEDVINQLPKPSVENSILFRLGLATQIQPSSTTMKFLSCDGPKLLLTPAIGMTFVDVVRLHLIRLFQLDAQDTTIQYELKCAWPPCISIESYKKCEESQFTGDVVKSEEHIAEIKSICEEIVSVQEQDVTLDKKLHAVLYHDAIVEKQGPEMFVLHVEKSCAYLDLYQIKNRNSIPSKNKLVEWMHSLGLQVQYKENGICEVITTPTLSKPLYTSTCLIAMVESFHDVLKIPVHLRHRYLVIKQSCNDINEEQMVYLRPLILGQHVRIWTSNFLEPTFTAIPITTNSEESAEERMADERRMT